MKKQIVYRILFLFSFFLSFYTVQAQQEMKAKKYDNPKWLTVVFIKFSENKYSRAKEIITNYFEKAGQKAGTPSPSLVLDVMSGEWDMMLTWDMKNGIDEMNWETSPDDVKWMKAMGEIVGGPDKAKAILDEYTSLITRSTRYIAKKSQF